MTRKKEEFQSEKTTFPRIQLKNIGSKYSKHEHTHKKKRIFTNYPPFSFFFVCSTNSSKKYCIEISEDVEHKKKRKKDSITNYASFFFVCVFDELILGRNIGSTSNTYKKRENTMLQIINHFPFFFMCSTSSSEQYSKYVKDTKKTLNQVTRFFPFFVCYLEKKCFS